MLPARLPERLALDELPLTKAPTDSGSCSRGIQISLPEGSLEKLVQAIRDSDGAQLSLGKKPAIFIGPNKVHPIQPLARAKSFVYVRHTDEKRARLSSVLSLQDAAAQPKKDDLLDMNDPAFLSLQQSLAELAHKKQANTTKFVKDSSQLPPAKSGRQALKAAKASSMLKNHRHGLFDQNKPARSLPSSPSLSGMTPTPASKPTVTDMRRNALKTSLIHLLAVRAVSDQYILKTLRCDQSDIKDLLEKYGQPNRMNNRKYDLSPKGYRELDVWGFDYKDPEDRQNAIDRAINAFDRQRISVREPVWQMLLPKEDRGKGKILSKLNLHTGPVERVKTPQIHVQTSSEGQVNGKQSPSEERPGRLGPSSAAARSGSQEPASKPKLSEKEAQAKRLLSKPKPTITASSAATSSPSMAPKTSPKTVPKKTAPKKAAVTAKNPKVKSDEFILDSDEDTEMEDAPITLARPASKTTSSSPPAVPMKDPKATTKPSPPPSGAAPNHATAPPQSKPLHKKTASSVSASTKLRVPDSELRSSSNSQVPRARKTSSPSKPSRLGSSPPTNASDLDREAIKSTQSSSSSSSPLINQRRESLIGKSSKGVPKAAAASRHTPSDGSSDRPLKRKAGDITSAARDTGRSDREQSSSKPDRNSGQLRPEKASERSGAGLERPVKRRAASPQPRSVARDARSTVALSAEHLQSAKRFKELHVQYSTMLKEIRALSNPPADRVQKLRQMYSKLSERKKSLTRLVAT